MTITTKRGKVAMNPYTAQRIALADTYLPAAGPLATTNRGFHECYNHLLGETLDRLGYAIPVLVMLHDDLHLSAAGSRQYVQVVPEHYHQLKAVAHSGFGSELFLFLMQIPSSYQQHGHHSR